MELLTAAVVVLWLLVLILGAVVWALARQVGVLYERVAPAGALMLNQALKVGDPAPQVAVKSLSEKSFEVGAPMQLLFFLAPDCPICKSLLPVLKSMQRAEPQVQTILLSDGEDTAEHQSYVQSESLQQFEYALSEVAGRAYGVGKLPYAVLIDQQGNVASLGIVNSREHLESLFEAQRMGVASIQDYLQQPEAASAEPAAAGAELYHDATK